LEYEKRLRKNRYTVQHPKERKKKKEEKCTFLDIDSCNQLHLVCIKVSGRLARVVEKDDYSRNSGKRIKEKIE